MPWHIPCRGVCYGDSNLVFIASDWHMALLPVYLPVYYRDNGLMEFSHSILVIHNMAPQVCSCESHPAHKDWTSYKCWTPIEFFTCPVHLQGSWNVKVERITEQIQTTESLDFAGGSGLHCLFLSITMKELWPRENMYSDAEVNLQMCWWRVFGPELLAKKMHMLWLIT